MPIFDNFLLQTRKKKSFIRSLVSGSMYKISDVRKNSDIETIKTRIDTMRALARDSQISTALNYYATDATTPNTGGRIIWATSEPQFSTAAEIINKLFDKWQINRYARDHILELATIGNLYIPTTELYKQTTEGIKREYVAIDSNTIPDANYNIIPSTKIPPEDIIHVWFQGTPCGYVWQPEGDNVEYTLLPEESVIHFSLGGLLGEYTITDAKNERTYDIQFSNPLMEQAVQPTQTLSLLEDALLLSSLSRVIKFICVEAGTEENEIRQNLQMIKDTIEQQLSLNTASGDAQSFINPQSPNNLIYLPKINGTDPISISDLDMTQASDSESKLLNYYQDKKLSVLGVPKEAMNYSSNEGLGGAGSVLSQRSALYANALSRIETAYIEGWRDAINKYFVARGFSGLVNKFTLHMNPIITTQSTIQFDKRDQAISQANNIVGLMQQLHIDNADQYKSAIVEILSEVLPQTGADASEWKVDMNQEEEGAGGGMGGF